MNEIYFIDTCVLLNILRVPKKYDENKSKEHSKKLIDISYKANATIIMPISVIIETGNFINHIDSDYHKRQCLKKFMDILKNIKEETAPWLIYGYEYFQEDLNKIIDTATELSPYGVGMGDAFILESFNRYIDTLEPYKKYLIEIWSDDEHLQAYSQNI
ncbi:hypothetical protein ABID30_003214 [Enterococcus rotai]|uniref:hypothetical protein n=1 Tax=Enterococcus rotai TaxID=118060 RepID=UPI0033959BE4